MIKVGVVSTPLVKTHLRMVEVCRVKLSWSRVRSGGKENGGRTQGKTETPRHLVSRLPSQEGRMARDMTLR